MVRRRTAEAGFRIRRGLAGPCVARNMLDIGALQSVLSSRRCTAWEEQS
jgi:hypothetical protein